MSFPFSIVIIINFLIALLAIAFYTLLERKLLGYFQLRKGPNKISLIGLPQPLADALKLFFKEQTPPSLANLLPFYFAPILGLFLALFIWTLYPSPSARIFFPLGALLFLCVSRINVYTTLAAGWFSNSKYALLGAIRSVAQTISYEVRMALIIISPIIFHFYFDLSVIISLSIVPKCFLIPPLIFIWFISSLAETNRTPFDFAEGESELVSGFNIEYRAGNFALIFIAEYIIILFISLLTTSLFLLPPTSLILLCPTITLFIANTFVWVRASFPRLRYDQLISLSWKHFLPATLATLLISYSLTTALSTYIRKLI